jgi:hypothetical protein
MHFTHPAGNPPEVIAGYLDRLQGEIDRLRAAAPTIDALSSEETHHLRGFLHYAEHLDDYLRELIGQKSSMT